MFAGFCFSNYQRLSAATYGSPSVPKNISALPDFENALSEIENIVNSMEGGQLPLSSALDAYQRGVILLRHCQSTLDAAGSRLQALDDQSETVKPMICNTNESPAAS